MDDLAAWLLERIAEDEAAARAALKWQEADPADRWRGLGGGLYDGQGDNMAGYVGDDIAPHIARWDPARVLAECAAKRRIVDEYREACTEGWAAELSGGLNVAVRLLALPYADRPGYCSQWAL